ncbi:MAG: hypothetical protein ACI9ES_002659 [Oceanospirillaceae bacterium]|jgi:hypothetical protein
MGKITRNCPHCHTQSVSFAAYAEKQKPNERVFVGAFHCENCYGGYIVEAFCETGQVFTNTNGNIEQNANIHLQKEYPLPQSVDAPNNLPNNIENFYLQSAHSLNAGSHDASAMMSRKVLEVAVKTLHPEGTGNLYRRIEALEEIGIITQELKDWAHIIRDDGNEAAHEQEPVTPTFSTELLSFAEMFLMYTFTMPGMVADRRQETSE